MTHVWCIGFISTFAGIGAGGIIASCINGLRRSIGTIYAVCAGLLLGLISFEIMPEAILIGNWQIVALGFLAGVILFEIIHMRLHRNPVKSHKDSSLKTGLFLAFIISIHNFPVGMVMGTSEHSGISFALLQSLILHNIPEGMILFTPFVLAGVRIHLLFLLSVLIALPVALGAMMGEMIGMQNNLLWAFLISLTTGIIYMVAIKEILLESIKNSSNRYSLFITLIAFSLMGVYLIYV